MKAILLAAGRGTRISKSIGNIPKSMVDVGGEPLLKHTIDMLTSFMPEKNISIIVGYKNKIIEEYFSSSYVRFYYNPFYYLTNSLASLWFARDELTLGQDIIIANADVFWSDRIYKLIERDTRDAVMLSDVSTISTGDYFFGEAADHSIVKYGKELVLEDRTSEYLGVAKIRADFVPRFKKQLIEMVNQQKADRWWEDVLYSLTDKCKIYSKDVSGEFWAEVDFIEDYERILRYMKSNEGKKLP